MAAGLTGAYAETIPNFEVLTLTAFGAGVLLGVRDGAMVAGLLMLVYSLLNPYGLAPPLVTLAQVTGSVAAGIAGGVFARLELAERSIRVRAVFLAVLGLGLTLFFDLITNLATGVLFGQMRVTLLAGIPYSLWHCFWNLILFVALGTPLTGVLAHYRSRLS